MSASKPQTSRIVSAEYLPIVDLPRDDKYFTLFSKIVEYLRRLSGLIQQGGGMPNPPDTLLNYVLVYDRDVNQVLWRPINEWWAQPDIYSATTSYFDKSTLFPAGVYRVYYLYGEMNYSTASFHKHCVNRGAGFEFMIRHSDDLAGTHTDIVAPGDHGSHTDYSECYLASMLQYIEFTHAGGAIGMYLNDSPYNDNSSNPGVSTPVFSLRHVST